MITYVENTEIFMKFLRKFHTMLHSGAAHKVPIHPSLAGQAGPIAKRKSSHHRGISATTAFSVRSPHRKPWSSWNQEVHPQLCGKGNCLRKACRSYI